MICCCLSALFWHIDIFCRVVWMGWFWYDSKITANLYCSFAMVVCNVLWLQCMSFMWVGAFLFVSCIFLLQLVWCFFERWMIMSLFCDENDGKIDNWCFDKCYLLLSKFLLLDDYVVTLSKIGCFLVTLILLECWKCVGNTSTDTSLF